MTSQRGASRQLPASWTRAPVAELFDRLKTGPKKDARTVTTDGTIPVLDQSADSVFGYHDGEPGITASSESPVVTFSNHRCYVRLIRYPFSVIQNVIPMRPRDGMDARFFYYSVIGRTPVTEYKGHWPEFLLLTVNVPPIDEQRRIAAVLGALDDKIELNRKMNRTLEEMAQAIFKSWFIDFDGVDASEMVESELGPIPKGWELTHLGEALSVLQTGKRPKGGVKGTTTGVPSIGAESIVRVGSFDFGKTKFIPKDFFDSLKKGVLEDRDVLLYKDGGKPGDFRPHVSMFGNDFPFADAAINSHVYRLRAEQVVSQEYLYFWLASDRMMKLLRSLGTGAAIPGIPRRNLATVPLVVPTSERAQAFQSLAAPLVSRIFENSKQSRTLAELRDTLLPKLISGELRVPEAESMVEAAL